MKLRQIVINSLPRPKSKHKQKQGTQKHPSPPGSPNSPTKTAGQAVGSSSPKPAESAIKGATPRPFQLNLKTPVYEGSAERYPRIRPGLGDNRGNGSTAVEVTQRADLNLNTESTNCACYKYIRSLSGSSSPEEECYMQSPVASDTPSLSLSTSSAEDSGFISLPKTRTRIKTNPWLPSPCSSPATSPDISPASSSTPSPVYIDRHNFHPFPKLTSLDEKPCQTKAKRRKKYKTGNGTTMTTPLNIPVSPSAELSLSNCPKTTEESNSLLERSFLSESDNCGPESGLHSLDNSISLCSDTSSVENPNDNHRDLVHCSDAGSSQTPLARPHEQVVKQVIKDNLIDTQVSFQYEEAFESQLEVKGVGEYIGSRDELSDDSCDHIFNDPLGSRAHDFDSEYCPSGYDSSPVTDYDSETETDDTVCDDYYTATGFRGNGRPGPYNDLFQDYYQNDGDCKQKFSDNNRAENDIKVLSESTPFPRQRVLNSEKRFRGRGVEHSQFSSHQQQEHLRISKEVVRHHQEQMLVDQHLQEAQEAERLRLEERRRLKKEVNLHRKRLLLRTLQELQSNLEDQSRRLQQTYSTVLSMQQAIICDRRQQPPSQPPADIYEAPF